jgi:lipoprotein-anchoring transpeptidase ErfK/SrfK
LRAAIAVGVIAVALGGSLGSAAAQYYAPPAYYPPPPGYYPPPPAPYASPAPIYRDANGVPYDQSGAYAANSYPMSRPYFAPQPLPVLDGQAMLRPPGDVANAAPAEATGSVRGAQSAAPERPTVVAALPPEEQPDQTPANLPPQFRRQLVNYQTTEPAGTIVIDTPNTYLYLVLGNGQALRYGIGVGREGFTWSGVERISRMKEWPDWFPPKEMIARQPYLPRFMAGGDTNPLGARALYLGNTEYRIHGTNQPSTIGTFVSSGCIRLTNDDVSDLYSRVGVGTRVLVLPGNSGASASQVPFTR